MVTIIDIAKKVNLSKTLVARALNGEPGVSQKSREKILHAARELNYRPNVIAKTLNTSKTNCIGVILDSLCDTLYFDMIGAIQENARLKGFKVIFCSISDDEETKKNYVDYFTQGMCDGVIIYGSKINDLDYINRLAKSNFPLVVIENEIPTKDVNNILVDNVYGGYIATEYLINSGLENIYHFLGDMDKSASVDRQIGYLNAMKHANLGRNIKCIDVGFSEMSGYENMKKLIEENNIPEGIFFAGDLAAYGAVRAIFEYQPELINKIRLIGFDEDIRPNFNIPYPLLSTVRQPIAQLGKIATNILLSQIIDKNNDVYIETLKPELIIKET
jgi:LacI family transcriptional regulator